MNSYLMVQTCSPRNHQTFFFSLYTKIIDSKCEETIGSDINEIYMYLYRYRLKRLIGLCHKSIFSKVLSNFPKVYVKNKS